MKSILKLGFFAVVALLSASCGSKASGEAQDESRNVGIVSVDSLLADPDRYVGQVITIEGECSHLCAHGGRKAFILGSDENTIIRCDGTEEMGWAFPEDAPGHMMKVTGEFVEQRIGEEEVAQMERKQAQRAEMLAEEGVKDAKNEPTGCETERKAAGQGELDTFSAQMADYRARIADRLEKEGKPYLSFYSINATSYEVLPK